MASVERRRSEEVRVKLAPAVAERLAAIAERRGLLLATLAAVALGEYVEKQDQQAQLSRMVALDSSKRMSEMAADGGALEKAIAEAMTNPALIALLGMEAPEAETQAGAGQVPDRRPQPSARSSRRSRPA